MGIRERKIERYLREQVTNLGRGGVVRKWAKSNVDGVPDQIVIVNGLIYFVEVKTDDGKLTPSQQRELPRLAGAGAVVRVCVGHGGVDALINEIMTDITELEELKDQVHVLH